MIGLWMRVYWKKASKNQDFSAHWKYDFPEIFWFFFQKMSKFKRPQMPNNLKYSHVGGINGKKVSISFIWYQLVVCVNTGLVTARLWKKAYSWTCRKSDISPFLKYSTVWSTWLFGLPYPWFNKLSKLNWSNSGLASKFNNRKLSIFVWKHLPNIMN